MDLRSVEQFLRVVEFGSINRAAKELGVTQPALNRSLLQLERELGQQLLVRSPTGVIITQAGTVLASRAESILRSVGELREELRGDPAGRVVIGMPPALRQLVTLPAIYDIRNNAPGTIIRVFEGMNVFLRDMLKQGVLDIAVVAVEQVPEAEFVPASQVGEPLVLARSKKFPAPPDPAQIQDVVQFPLVLPGLPNALRRIVDRGVRRQNLTARIPIEAENLDICLEFVQRGIVAQTVTLNSALVGRDLSSLRVAAMVDWEIHWAVVVRHQHQHAVSVRRLAAIIGKRLRELDNNIPSRAESIAS